jgi:hypothetical protein
MTRAVIVGVIGLVSASAVVTADPVKLSITHEPPPRHLRMRPRAAVAPTKPPPRPSPIPQPARVDAGAEATVVRDVDQRVAARVNLSYALDGTALTNNPSLADRRPNSDPSMPDLALLRSFGFGEGNVSTRGVGLPSLSTFFAGRFQLTQRHEIDDPMLGRVTTPPPVATWFEHSGYAARSLWAEVKDFLPMHELAPLRVRLGQLYAYGPWVLHLTGGLAEWDGKLIRATVYGGSRVPDYVSVPGNDRAGVGGASVRVDLRDLKRPVPFSIAGEILWFTAANAQQPSTHTQIELDWRPRDDLALIGQARSMEGKAASEHVQFRSRYKQVTNLVFDLTRRHATDWRWDPSVIGPDPTGDPLAPKRYLELGPVLPQLLFSARGGTLIAENIDLLGRAAIAADVSADRRLKNTYNAGYAEIGGALEVRLRRTIALGASLMTRQTPRNDPISSQIEDRPTLADALPINQAIGERGFSEGGTSLRMSLGARKFSATVEVYGRRTRYALDYCVGTKCISQTDTGVPDTDTRFGGRFQIDAWLGQKLRMFASYDVSSRLDFAPDITGYKSLRLMVEGLY